MNKQIFIIITIFIFVSLNFCYSQTGWVSQNISIGNYSLTSVFPLNQTVCFASAEYNTTYENYYAVYKTSNNGNNWLPISNGTGWFLKKIIFVDSITGFTCGGLNRLYMTENQYGKCILKTTNEGQNWNVVYSIISIPGSEMEINDMCFINGNTGWACSRDGSVLRTTNGGTNFTSYNTTPLFRKSSVSFVDNQNGWVVGDSGRVAYSNNGGVNWTVLNSITTSNLKSIIFLNTSTGYLCGNNNTIYKSTNGGLNWFSQTSGVPTNLNSIYFLNTDTGWIAGINTILKTTNGGINWINQYNGTSSLNSVRFLSPHIGWACGGNKMLYTNSGGVVNINVISSVTPSKYKLYQNYPNPFNPTTTIKFDVASSPLIPLQRGRFVKLMVYDNLGREVITLLNKPMNPGTYEIEFNAAILSSGIYYYKMSAGNYTSAKSMVVIK